MKGDEIRWAERIWPEGSAYQISTFSHGYFVHNDYFCCVHDCTRPCLSIGPSIGWRSSSQWRVMKLGGQKGHGPWSLHTKFQPFPMTSSLVITIWSISIACSPCLFVGPSIGWRGPNDGGGCNSVGRKNWGVYVQNFYLFPWLLCSYNHFVFSSRLHATLSAHCYVCWLKASSWWRGKKLYVQERNFRFTCKLSIFSCG